MPEGLMLGAKVRLLRRRETLTQAALAERLGISASYLNLIENNRRPLTAKLLLRLAQEFELDLSSFAPSGDARMVAELREVFGDAMFDSTLVTASDVREFAAATPSVAKAVLELYRAYRSTLASAEAMAQRLSGSAGTTIPLGANPTEVVNDLLQARGNFFPTIEAAAERLWADARLQPDGIWSRLIEFLEERGVQVRLAPVEAGQAMRTYDPVRKCLTISEVLPPRSRRFQLAHQVGLLCFGEQFDALDLLDEDLAGPNRSLIRVAIANYFAAAVLMPYGSFLAAAKEVRYDLVLLAHRYRTSFEQVCHRLTTLRKPGAEGVPFHFLRIDVAGNISKRFSASGIRMPRFSGACPRWNVHSAFLTPGMIRLQLSRMPDGTLYFCLARTVERASGGYHTPHTVHSIGLGCELRFAKEMVYADGLDLADVAGATPVGVTCRTCEQNGCEQRVFASVQQPLVVDENVRGLSFYAPPEK